MRSSQQFNSTIFFACKINSACEKSGGYKIFKATKSIMNRFLGRCPWSKGFNWNWRCWVQTWEWFRTIPYNPSTFGYFHKLCNTKRGGVGGFRHDPYNSWWILWGFDLRRGEGWLENQDWCYVIYGYSHIH